MTTTASDWVCLLPKNSAVTELAFDLDNRGLAYGDGFFTTMGVIDGSILWADYHQQRLISHAHALQLDIDSEEILAILKIQAQQIEQGMLKLVVIRTPQSVRGYGYVPSDSGSATEVWLKSSTMKVATAVQLCLPDGQSVPIQL